MGRRDLESALDECLNAVDPEAAAKRWPKFEADLIPLIKAAQRVRETPRAVPSPRTKAATLEWLLMRLRFKAQTRQAQEGLREVA